MIAQRCPNEDCLSVDLTVQSVNHGCRLSRPHEFCESCQGSGAVLDWDSPMCDGCGGSGGEWLPGGGAGPCPMCGGLGRTSAPCLCEDPGWTVSYVTWSLGCDDCGTVSDHEQAVGLHLISVPNQKEQ